MHVKDRSKLGIIANFKHDRQEKAHSFRFEEQSHQHFLQRYISSITLLFGPVVGSIQQCDVKICLAWKIIGEMRLADTRDFGDPRLRHSPYALCLDNIQGGVEDELALIRLSRDQNERLPFLFHLSHCLRRRRRLTADARERRVPAAREPACRSRASRQCAPRRRRFPFVQDVSTSMPQRER